MTNSWELPSHVAGDVIPMNNYRRREREVVPDDDWEQGQDSKIIVHPKWKIRRGPSVRTTNPEPTGGTDWSEAARRLGEIEPYDPSQHHAPAELYSQNSLDALERAGFHPRDEPGVWHRPVTTDAGEELGASHIIFHEPGHRRPSDNSRAPWHLMTDPETAGEAYRTLGGALSAADQDREQIRKMPKHAGLYLLSPWEEDSIG